MTENIIKALVKNGRVTKDFTRTDMYEYSQFFVDGERVAEEIFHRLKGTTCVISKQEGIHETFEKNDGTARKLVNEIVLKRAELNIQDVFGDIL